MHRHRWTLFGLLLALLLGPSLSWAATYYVSNAGSDSNACSLTLPCLTIATGRTKLSSGDTLYLRGGTYTEGIVTVWSQSPAPGGIRIPSGTSWATATTIAGYPGETVTLAGGTGIELRLQQSGNPVLFQYIIFQNFTITNDGGLGAQGCGYADANGNVPLNCGPHFIRFQDIEISGKGCSASVGNGYGASDLQYLNITVHDGGCDRLDHGFYVCSPRTLYDGVEVYNYAGYGLQHFDEGSTPAGDGSRNCGEGTIIRNSRFHHNAWDGEGAVVLTHGKNMQFTNNLVYDNAGFKTDGTGGSRALVGVSLSYNSPVNVQVYNNTFFGNGSEGLHIDAAAIGPNYVKNNVFWNNPVAIQNLSGTTVLGNNLIGSNPQFASVAPGVQVVDVACREEALGLTLALVE